MIAGIVLAAGEGLRMGQPKAWLRTDREGESFFSRACRLLAAVGADPVVGVVGPGAEQRAMQAEPAITIVVNPRPEAGQLSSLQLGLQAVRRVGCEAAMVLPVDVPRVSPLTALALLERWRASRPAVVRPVSSNGAHGHPVVFSRVLFDVLLRADPLAGAKPIVRAHASTAGEVLVADDGAFFDVDTVEDYIRAFGRPPQTVTIES